MSKSQILRLGDLRAIYLLVGECRELGGDPVAWRQHLVTGLLRTLGGAVGLSFEFQLVAKPGQRADWVQSLSAVEVGWRTESDRQHFVRFMQEGQLDRCPFVMPLHSSTQTLYTCTRRELITDRSWYGSAFVDSYLRPARNDDMVFSRHQPATGVVHLLNVARTWGEKPFPERAARLLALCHADIARLRGTRLADSSSASVMDLPRRLRQVLACLLEGDSEKQVAFRLGIAAHTVHEYVKHLHRRFQVNSRGELLTRCWPLLPVLHAAGSQMGRE